MRKILFPLALAAFLGLLAACGDDSTSPDDAFAVTVRAVDSDGNPVEGLDLMVVMDSPYYQDAKAAEKAVTGIRFIVPTPSLVALTIEDVAGGHIRTLLADTLVAGWYQLKWDGRDDEGVHQYSGLYRVRLRAGWDPTHPDVDLAQPMYMALIDFDQATLGVTDADGRVVLRDKRLFPALYGAVDMEARDENGDPVGVFPLINTMRFYLGTVGGRAMYKRDVLHGGQTIELVWPGIVTAGEPVLPVSPPVRRLDVGVPPDTTFVLDAPYPNPFN